MIIYRFISVWLGFIFTIQSLKLIMAKWWTFISFLYHPQPKLFIFSTKLCTNSSLLSANDYKTNGLLHSTPGCNISCIFNVPKMFLVSPSKKSDKCNMFYDSGILSCINYNVINTFSKTCMDLQPTYVYIPFNL